MSKVENKCEISVNCSKLTKQFKPTVDAIKLKKIKKKITNGLLLGYHVLQTLDLIKAGYSL